MEKPATIGIIIVLMFVFIGSLLLSANKSPSISFEDKHTITPPAYPTIEPTPMPDYTIKFDVTKSNVGNNIGTLKITDIKGFKSPPSNDSAVVSFSGTITITGDISYTPEGQMMGESICIYNLDKESLMKIPRLLNQNGDVYLCFSNLEEAKNALKNVSHATINVDNYVLTYIPIEALSSVRLRSVEVK